MSHLKKCLVVSLVVIGAACGGSDSTSSGEGAGGDESDGTAVLENIFDTDLLVACDGVGFPAAAKYAPTPGVIHPVIVLAGKGTKMYVRSSAVREAWTRSWTSENTLGLAEIELVACAEQTSSMLVQECTGYEIDGATTDHVVNLNEVVYDVSLHEAATGAEVATTTITARDDSCPTYVSFSEGETTQEYDSFDDEAIQAFIEPHVTP